MRKMQSRDIVLASASPRRKELLKLAGLRFRIIPGDYEEDLSLPMVPQKLVEFLSRKKAESVSEGLKNVILISADTIIDLDGRVLGKPHTPAGARRMLRELSGRQHRVITGYTIIDTETGMELTRSVITKVWFKDLDSKEIDAYVKTGEPLDKAGAYAIQGLGSLLIKKISGDYFNVIGLPISSVVEDLKRFGVRVL